MCENLQYFVFDTDAVEERRNCTAMFSCEASTVYLYRIISYGILEWKCVVCTYDLNCVNIFSHDNDEITIISSLIPQCRIYFYAFLLSVLQKQVVVIS